MEAMEATMDCSGWAAQIEHQPKEDIGGVILVDVIQEESCQD